MKKIIWRYDIFYRIVKLNQVKIANFDEVVFETHRTDSATIFSPRRREEVTVKFLDEKLRSEGLLQDNEAVDRIHDVVVRFERYEEVKPTDILRETPTSFQAPGGRIVEVGIDETMEVFDAVIKAVEFANAVYFDDNKINAEDLPDIISKGPALLNAILAAVKNIKSVPAELKDLDQSEIAQLEAKFGSIVFDPRWQKVFSGVMLVADGLVELTQAEEA